MTRISADTHSSIGTGRTPNTQSFVGTDAVADVFTLSNTSLSSQEHVTMNGQTLTVTADYTVSHNASSSTITIPGVFDSDLISVRYFT